MHRFRNSEYSAQHEVIHNEHISKMCKFPSTLSTTNNISILKYRMCHCWIGSLLHQTFCLCSMHLYRYKNALLPILILYSWRALNNLRSFWLLVSVWLSVTIRWILNLVTELFQLSIFPIIEKSPQKLRKHAETKKTKKKRKHNIQIADKNYTDQDQLIGNFLLNWLNSNCNKNVNKQNLSVYKKPFFVRFFSLFNNKSCKRKNLESQNNNIYNYYYWNNTKFSVICNDISVTIYTYKYFNVI